MEFDVFLSHNSKDKPAVRDLARRLAERGIRVWLDEEQLTPGRNWQPLLEHGIEQSATGAVLVGQDGLGPWEDEEMQALLLRAVRGKKPVIPVLLPGAPEKPALPLFLESRMWVDLRQGYSDRGLDALVWGITGKRLGTPSAADEQGSGRQRPSGSKRGLVVSLLLLVCTAFFALYFLRPWEMPGSTTEKTEDFAVWIVAEQDGPLTPRLVTLPLDERRKGESRASLLQRITQAAEPTVNGGRARIFRLKDGTEITAEGGDLFAAENRGVLVLDKALVDRFPDAHVAFTFVRSQLPNP